jgi:hypothetical protein
MDHSIQLDDIGWKAFPASGTGLPEGKHSMMFVQ